MQRILIVDDEKPIRDMLDKFFSNKGYETFVAENFNEALKILDNHNIQMIVTDLNMPDMSGIDLCKEIRVKRPVAQVFAITGGEPHFFELAECRAIGFDDYFKKPVQLPILFNAVKNAFEKIERWKGR